MIEETAPGQDVLELPPTYDSIKDVTVWRCISSGRRKGHWEYLFDDYVLEISLGSYLAETSRRGSQRISLYRMGQFRDVLGSTVKQPMHGTISIAHERKLHKLDEWSDIPSEKEYTDAFNKLPGAISQMAKVQPPDLQSGVKAREGSIPSPVPTTFQPHILTNLGFHSVECWCMKL